MSNEQNRPIIPYIVHAEFFSKPVGILFVIVNDTVALKHITSGNQH